ncbi:MAG: nickel pincer cofactor biosynthesis protein LarB [Candidatus Omnitrophica bacterium]|nr:nickel pincer cofactor biosynthesis protein LarB [Candidatus Omnitrophota bacterium]
MGLKKRKNTLSKNKTNNISLDRKKPCTARIDISREERRGFPEVIYCPGKTAAQIKNIAVCILRHNDTLLLTRASRKIYTYLKESIPDLKYNSQANLIYLCKKKKKNQSRGKILVLSAGTSDIPVAEEAAVTAELMGNHVDRLYDVGVAGIHRLLDKVDLIRQANVIVVVAGMEGALASVLSGMVERPVIGVPTSVGYGASFSGIAPLLTMLNSCSPGVSVVNIDNGFGAGYMAGLINK